MTKREFLDTWFKRVWEDQDSSAIYEYYAPDGQASGLGEAHQAGPDDFVAFHKAMLNLVSDVKVSYVQIIEEGDWISYMGTLDMVDRRTGKHVQMTGGAICKLVNGQMVVAHNSWDFLGLFSRLGLAPENAFTTMLAGKSITGEEPVHA